MNVYELEKQATPGLALAGQTYDDGSSGSAITIGQKCWQRFNTPHELDPDARLLAHCRNNFMRLLRDYKNLVSNAKACDCLCLHGGTDHDKEIEELEKVK